MGDAVIGGAARLPGVDSPNGDHIRIVAGGENAAGAEVALVAGGAYHDDPGLPGGFHGQRHGVLLGRTGHVTADRDVEHTDAVLILVGDRPSDRRDHIGRAALAEPVQHLDGDDVGLRGDAAELCRRVAAQVGWRRGGAIAGDQARDERAMAGVIVGVLLVLEKVDPAGHA